MPEHVLGVAGQLVRLGKGQRPVQVLAGVAVVPGLRAEGGQVAHGPGGVVVQAGRDRDLEGLLQLDPPTGSPPFTRAEPMLVRAWVSVSWSSSRRASSIARAAQPIAASLRLASMSSWAWLL